MIVDIIIGFAAGAVGAVIGWTAALHRIPQTLAQLTPDQLHALARAVNQRRTTPV